MDTDESAELARISQSLEDHTQQDASNFESLNDALVRLEDRLDKRFGVIENDVKLMLQRTAVFEHVNEQASRAGRSAGAVWGTIVSGVIGLVTVLAPFACGTGHKAIAG